MFTLMERKHPRVVTAAKTRGEGGEGGEGQPSRMRHALPQAVIHQYTYYAYQTTPTFLGKNHPIITIACCTRYKTIQKWRAQSMNVVATASIRVQMCSKRWVSGPGSFYAHSDPSPLGWLSFRQFSNFVAIVSSRTSPMVRGFEMMPDAAVGSISFVLLWMINFGGDKEVPHVEDTETQSPE